MELSLGNSDLTEEGQKTPLELLKFEHLNEKAKGAVIAVGLGTYRNDRGTHQRIYAPDPK